MKWIPLVLIALALASPRTAAAETGSTRAAARDFVRISSDSAKIPLHLQVAVTRYAKRINGQAITVDLVGVVHVGDASYYETLNQQFDQYDRVLYEMVAPEGATVQPGANHDGLLSRMQLAMTEGLDLSFQLDEIDYTASNFVHADLSPEEFSESLMKGLESPLVAAWQVMAFTIRETARGQLQASPEQQIKDLRLASEDRMKVMFARELAGIDQAPNLFGNDETSTLIGARNARAIAVLEREIASGARHLAIFYGAAHMPDLQRRLLEELEFAYDRTEWRNAWLLQQALADSPEPAVDTSLP
ncbi:MAG: hypothetical protein AAGF46_09555 [Pseudomonadota bacterium]